MYKSFPALWDVNSNEYNDHDTKMVQYQVLLQKYREMYPDAELIDVKKKINSLRTSFRREKKLLENGKAKSKSCYYNALSFLHSELSHSEIEEKGSNSNHREEIPEVFKEKKYLDLEEDAEDSNLFETEREENENSLIENTMLEKTDIHLTHEQKFTLEFIETYKSLPSLWNITSSYYNDRQLKDLQYGILLEKYKEMYPNADKNDVKRKINTLRTNYRRDLKSGPPFTLFYFDKLSFLPDIEASLDVSLDDKLSEEYFETVDISEHVELEQTGFQEKHNKKEESGNKININRDKHSYEKKFILDFIEMYKSLPALWDVNSNEYNDHDTKLVQYQVLLQKYREMYPDAELIEVKKKINSLRTNFLRERKRLKNKIAKSNLYYYNALSFLHSELSHSEIEEKESSSNHREEISEVFKEEEYLDLEEDAEDSNLFETGREENENSLIENTMLEKTDIHLTHEQKFTLEFIETYKSLPSLWNVTSSYYYDRELKDLQYGILLKKYKEMYPNADTCDVKRKINTLRTNYRRDLKSGPPFTLFYFDKISFLQDIKLPLEYDDTQSEEYMETYEYSEYDHVDFQNNYSNIEGIAKITKTNYGNLNDDKKFILEFIEVYKSFPALWDVNSRDYNDRETKRIQYQVLLQKYRERYPNAEVVDVKKKINCLRSNFGKETKRLQSDVIERKSYNYDAMSFLLNKKSNTDSKPIESPIKFLNEIKFEYDDTQSEEYLDTLEKSEYAALKQANFLSNHNQIDEKETRIKQNCGNLNDEKMFILEFIDMYKSLPALWNTNSNEYKDRKTKDIQYLALLQKYRERYPNSEVIDVKKKINCLRSNFSKETKRLQSDVTEKKSYNYDAMSFLLNKESHSDLKEKEMDFDNTEMNFEYDDSQSEEYLETIENFQDNYDGISKNVKKKTKNRLKLNDEKIFVLEFIEAYKSLAALWDVNSKEYNDREIKEIQYRVLLQKYKERYPDAEIIDVKKKINCLRSNFLKETKRLQSDETENKSYNYDAMSFLCKIVTQSDSTKVTTNMDSAEPTKGNAALNYFQIIELAQLYKVHDCLWDEKVIAYRFANRRREAVENILHKLNAKCELNLDKSTVEKEISKLRRVCSSEKREKLKCKRNNTVYKQICPYYEHISFLEIDVSPFECEVCGKLLSNLGRYKTHVSSHDNSLPFKCHICDHGFQLATNLAVHLRRHVQDYIYECKVCNKTFATNTELKFHIRFHTGEKPYFCELCGKSFRILAEFKDHKQRHEKRPRHKCPICSRRFYNKWNVKEHMKIHLQIRDQICTVCNKGFTTRKQLRQHEYIHMSDKKFSCKICGKRFSQSAGVSGHLKSHGIALSAINDNMQ